MNDDVKELVSEMYLADVRAMASRLDSIKEIVETQRERMLGIRGIDYERMAMSTHGAANGDAIPNAVAEFQELIAKYVEEVRDLTVAQREAYELIAQMENRTHADLLIRHYVLCHTWAEVADRMGYSDRHVRRIRKVALVELYDYIPESYKGSLPKAY